MNNQSNLSVIGLGNILCSDEGIGVYLLRRLQECSWPVAIDFIEFGVGGMQLLHLITGRQKVILLDCAFMGDAPGTIRRFTPDEVISRKNNTGLSLHEGDLLSILTLAATIGESPDEIIIFGIEPAIVTPGMELSPVLSKRLDEYQAMVTKEIFHID